MNEKQFARYLRAVRRRLTLPKKMKDRVMDNLRSSINERREAGQTDAEILAALGSAKQAASELTAQLPGYAFRKSPLRFICLGAAVLALLVGLLKTVTNLRGFASIGVIGGADGPTEIFIAGPQIFDWADVIAAGVVLVLGVAGYLLLRRLPRYAHYAAALAAEIFKANLTVMRAILSGRPCRPAIRRVHLPLREEGSRMLLANSITLTPGTVTVAVEDEDFLVLCLDAESADALPDWNLTTMLTKMEEETCS